jgi:two-component system CheB/CheR fusion protein
MSTPQSPQNESPQNDSPQPSTPGPDPAPSANNDFPVVGIGASAGGLEAFIQLISNLPNDTGMAFVLLQHLEPSQPSMLSDIIARSTPMPVQEVEDGMGVAPNQVYVIPPNQGLTLEAGKFHLLSRDRTQGSRRVIDVFFKSLAEDRGVKSIGVVLSGGDADGTRGIEAIKAAGGITLAQSEDTAQVSSMPHMAIATGQIDFVQPPADLARTLVEISRHPYITSPTVPEATAESTSSRDALADILALLKRYSRVDFSQYKPTSLNRRIARRMALHHLDSLDDYLQFLRDNPAEIEALYQEILIRVTSFFRDEDVFAALSQQVFPALVQNRNSDVPIRIWVAGCATGEEAYSIAMALLEYLADHPMNPPIQIFATDVNEQSIEIARIGWYSQAQVADVSPERLQRYFVPVDDGYQVHTLVRELCIFARQNLVNDPPFSRLDLISCRNVLIYFSLALQRRVLPMFHYGLKPQGYLLLGSSETVGEFTDLFAPLGNRHRIYTKLSRGPQQEINFSVDSYVPELALPRPVPSPDRAENLDPYATADQILLSRYAPACVLVNTQLEILQFRGQTGAYLAPSPGRASLNLLRMVRENLRLDLRTALYQARQLEQVVERDTVALREGDRTRRIRIEVVPFTAGDPETPYYLVMFRDIPTAADLIEVEVTPVDGSEGEPFRNAEIERYRQENQQLQDDLETTRSHLQSIIQAQEASNQDLRAANEEILSSNEELQSTNEELQTAKEEIQATNEELSTINDELYRRNAETARISDDFQNLLSSIHIPILMLEGDLRIRRFTPTATPLFNLITSDIGRPLSNINHQLKIDDLEQRIRHVIDTLDQTSQEVQDQEGRWYDLRIRPYRTLDNRIDGAVVVLVDIDTLKRQAEALTQARDYANAIVQTVREALVVLDANLRVVTANNQFYRMFQVSPGDTEQRSIFELGNGQWDIPQLRSLLHDLLPQNLQVEDYEVAHDFETIGPRTMRLNARKMVQPQGDDLILLAIEAVSEG